MTGEWETASLIEQERRDMLRIDYTSVTAHSLAAVEVATISLLGRGVL